MNRTGIRKESIGAHFNKDEQVVIFHPYKVVFQQGWTRAAESLNNNKHQKEKTAPMHFLARSFLNHCLHFQAITNTQLYYKVHKNMKWTV